MISIYPKCLYNHAFIFECLLEKELHFLGGGGQLLLHFKLCFKNKKQGEKVLSVKVETN